MPASAALLDSTASDRQGAAPEIGVQATLYGTYHLWGPLVMRHLLLCPTGALGCRMASGVSDGATRPATMSSAGNRRSGQRCDDASATDSHYCFCATVSVRATAALTPAWDERRAYGPLIDGSRSGHASLTIYVGLRSHCASSNRQRLFGLAPESTHRLLDKHPANGYKSRVM
jgi:hypothetical protein